jgi:signal transduction histidine kinase
LLVGVALEAACMALLASTHARDILGITGGLGALFGVLAAMLSGPNVGVAVASAGWGFFFLLVAERELESILTLPIWVLAAVVTGLLTRRLGAAEEARAVLASDLEHEAMTRDFVMTASHELRTPLAAISGAARTLAQRKLEPPQQERMLGLVIEQSDRLAHVLDDLLSASRLGGGMLNVQVEACEPLAVAREVVDAAEAAAPDGVTIGLAPSGTLPVVTADPAKLRQVLANLIGNAVKYSPAGGRVTVSLGLGREGLRFAVCDRGLGIPASEQRRIFQKFYRLDPAMTRGIGGTGLGLYIASELVRQMGGTIDVISSEGAGSTFWFELPFDEESPAPAKRPPAVGFAQRFGRAALSFSATQPARLARVRTGRREDRRAPGRSPRVRPRGSAQPRALLGSPPPST